MSTSTQRTYRYVRLGILGAVLAIGVALIVVLVGEGPLASISALHYTSGSAVFTGGLVAMALAFLVLAGRSPAQGLLDIAALVVPLIAIVPTPVEPGDAPGIASGCGVPCVPDAEGPAITTGLIVWVVTAVVVIAAAAVLGVMQGTAGPGLVVTLAAAGAIVAVVAVGRIAVPAAFLTSAHVAAASAFFALIAAVSALAGRRSVRPYRVVYLTVAVLIAVDLVALLTVVLLRFAGVDLPGATGVPLVLVGEVVALALFAVFWSAQTVQNWNELDPAFRAA